jgi:hypothetical protein
MWLFLCGGPDLVWSENSCVRSVIEFQEAAEALAGLDIAG